MVFKTGFCIGLIISVVILFLLLTYVYKTYVEPTIYDRVRSWPKMDKMRLERQLKVERICDEFRAKGTYVETDVVTKHLENQYPGLMP